MAWNIRVKMMTGITHSVQLVKGAVRKFYVRSFWFSRVFLHTGYNCSGTKRAGPR